MTAGRSQDFTFLSPKVQIYIRILGLVGAKKIMAARQNVFAEHVFLALPDFLPLLGREKLSFFGFPQDTPLVFPLLWGGLESHA